MAASQPLRLVPDPGNAVACRWPARVRARRRGGLGRHDFDVELANCEVSWPLTGGGALMVVRSGRNKWIVSHDEPAHGKLATTIAPIFARRRATDWKRALAEATSDAAPGAEPAPSA